MFDPTNYSECASAVVPVVKGHVNPSIKSDVYPLPTINEVLAELAGGKFFSKLDLDTAYTNGILIAVEDEAEHWERLRAVLQRLREAGLPLNRLKYQFTMEAVSFLRFKIDKRCIGPAIENIPPEGRQQLQVGDLNHPKVKEKSLAEMSETINERKRMKDRNLSVGDTVLWRSYGTGPRWMPGTVVKVRDLRDSMLTREEVS
ncbi:Transposon Tf2-11 polyprotein [Trichinella patagoniensis]|uniref:Transposon Tf2-11 polyprotein n=1 Tax=Trichinella patagoniensis TaxID=990121 RepID=A0A0V1A184_9BILA|nr:Transposon Tf2-11 polyprotein [Trichinella patagoniensis]